MGRVQGSGRGACQESLAAGSCPSVGVRSTLTWSDRPCAGSQGLLPFTGAELQRPSRDGRLQKGGGGGSIV